MRSRKYIPMLMLLALLSCAGKAGAQTVAVKSDLLTGGHARLAQPRCGTKAVGTFYAGGRGSLQPLSGRRRQTLETLVRAAGAALLDVPALRRTFLRGKPDVRRVQRSQGKAAFRAFQRGTFRKIRGRLYGSGNIIRLSLHPLPPLGTGDKHRRRIPAHPIRTLPLRALRRKDRKRKQEFPRSHQSLHILSVYDTIITR